MNELESLQQAVTDNNSVIDSAIIVMNDIKSRLDAAIAANNPAALQALSDSLGSEKEKLAAAIAANTPAAPVANG